MHSLYAKRRGVEKSLCMIYIPSATRQLGLSKHFCRLPCSVKVCLHHLQPSCSKRSHSSYSSQTSLLAVFAHSCKCILARLKCNQIEAEQPFLFYSPWHMSCFTSQGLAEPVKVKVSTMAGMKHALSLLD